MPWFCLALLILAVSLRAGPLENSELQAYFEAKVARIEANCLTPIETRQQWEDARPKYREQLMEMLGLSPLPPRGELHSQVTGKVDREGIVVEKIHFQSLPGLYVTANFYRPKDVTKPLPTILYVCGHGPVKTNGISYGNKVAYQHHGAWFARNGYNCLIIDTIQLGEIEGIHHGTYREGMWWWNSRGYTPAGVEAWNCMRALDYLDNRPEVDKSRYGVTGRSGGGAYSWWISAIDDRIKVAAPVAGITDLHNHVVDGVVEGHCDCMFFVNTYRWDYPMVAALVAPRPLLLCNSDKDSIFPLDGVLRTHAKVKKIYDLCGASANLGLLITEGPHKDTQDLQLPVFRWFNRYLKGEDPVISMAATKLFTPEELKVFDKLPEDEITSRIHETFVARTPKKDLASIRESLLSRTFSAWPDASSVDSGKESTVKTSSRALRQVEFHSEDNVLLTLWYSPVENAADVRLHVVDETGEGSLLELFKSEFGAELPNKPTSAPDERRVEQMRKSLRSYPRSVNAFLKVRDLRVPTESKKAIQLRRRYLLIGETLDSARVWDIQRGIDRLRALANLMDKPFHITAEGREAANVLIYSAITEKTPDSLTLINLPEKEADQPDYLNLARFTSLPDVLQQLISGKMIGAIRLVHLPQTLQSQ